MSTLLLELPDDQLHALKRQARALGVPVEVLLQVAIAELLARPVEELARMVAARRQGTGAEAPPENLA